MMAEVEEMESKLSELIDDLVNKYYGNDRVIWFNYVREIGDVGSDKYLVDIKFKEGFIIGLQDEKFAKFRWELNLKMNKAFSGWCKTAYKCNGGCHMCVDQKPYKIQFSEEVR